MKLLTLLMLLGLLIACEDTKEDDDLTKPNQNTKTQFLSPHDPCQEAPKDCVVVGEINVDQAIQLLKDTNQKEIEVGLQVNDWIDNDEQFVLYDPETKQPREVNCSVSYYQSRTVLKYENYSLWVEEKKSDFMLQPDTEDCKEALKFEHYRPVIIAKETYITNNDPSDISPEDREFLNKYYTIKHIKYRGETSISTNGVYDYQFEVDDGNGRTIVVRGKSGSFAFSNLTQTGFASNIVSHYVSKTEGFSTSNYEIVKQRHITTGVDTTHVDLGSVEIEDRTSKTMSTTERPNIFGI